MTWKKFSETAYFRDDQAYAGKDHTKNLKTFICMGPLGFEEKRGFKSIESAMKAADKIWINRRNDGEKRV